MLTALFLVTAFCGYVAGITCECTQNEGGLEYEKGISTIFAKPPTSLCVSSSCSLALDDLQQELQFAGVVPACVHVKANDVLAFQHCAIVQDTAALTCTTETTDGAVIETCYCNNANKCNRLNSQSGSATKNLSNKRSLMAFGFVYLSAAFIH